jgi:hypothetical protein
MMLVLLVPVVAVYVTGYLMLSAHGVYRPFTGGMNHVETWAWFPDGYFRDKRHVNQLTFTLFLPLWLLDNRYWHNDWTGQSGPRTL